MIEVLLTIYVVSLVAMVVLLYITRPDELTLGDLAEASIAAMTPGLNSFFLFMTLTNWLREKYSGKVIYRRK